MKQQDMIGTPQCCILIDLATVHTVEKREDTPFFDQVQYLFQELFQASRLNPGHLLLSVADHFVLHRYAKCRSTMREFSEKFGADSPSFFGNIASIRNLTTGRVMHVASLPDLDNATVRVGFFPIEFVQEKVRPPEIWNTEKFIAKMNEGLQ